ncbi:hypothetical protein E2C01_035169 [Portunus trituberculatus]|uniref:Uncharacterized protein n=1 Tax=Portunus trituberculatus TaxID=210409 RepID=A0A5B7F2G8_PORTR|nr:hypothetical protein [Portunus trituberculatus]
MTLGTRATLSLPARKSDSTRPPRRRGQGRTAQGGLRAGIITIEIATNHRDGPSRGTLQVITQPSRSLSSSVCSSESDVHITPVYTVARRVFTTPV